MKWAGAESGSGIPESHTLVKMKEAPEGSRSSIYRLEACANLTTPQRNRLYLSI